MNKNLDQDEETITITKIEYDKLIACKLREEALESDNDQQCFRNFIRDRDTDEYNEYI